MDAEANSLKRSREVFKKKDREIIAQSHGIDPAHPVLETLLSTAVRYSLDPLGGHLWIVDREAERVAKDGADPAAADADLRVGITRDGLLVVARRDERYGGMQFDAVRSEDTFKVKQTSEGAEIVHEYPDLSIEKDAKEHDYRGPLIGAYCNTFVQGQFPTYYFAWMSEHGQFNSEGDLDGTWAVYESSMIIKSAQSVTLRLAFGVTGVVGVDEIRRGEPEAEKPAREEPPDPTPFLLDLDLPTELKDPLVDMVAAANDAEANAWSLAKLRMRLSSEDPAILKKNAEAIVEELTAEAERRTPAAAA
jgi:hypothetical protein